MYHHCQSHRPNMINYDLSCSTSGVFEVSSSFTASGSHSRVIGKRAVTTMRTTNPSWPFSHCVLAPNAHKLVKITGLTALTPALMVKTNALVVANVCDDGETLRTQSCTQTVYNVSKFIVWTETSASNQEPSLRHLKWAK